MDSDSVDMLSVGKGDEELNHGKEREYRTLSSNLSEFSKHQVPEKDAASRTSSYFNSFNNKRIAWAAPTRGIRTGGISA